MIFMERGTDNALSVEPSIRFDPNTGAAIIDLGPAPNPLPSLQLTIRDVATGRYLTPDGWRKRATFLEAVTVATEPRLLLAIDAAITAHISTGQEVTIEELALGKRQRLGWPAPVIRAVKPATEPQSPQHALPNGFSLASWDEEKPEAEERPATTTTAVEMEASTPSTSAAREVAAQPRISRLLIAASIAAIFIGSGAALYGLKKSSDAALLMADYDKETVLLADKRQALDNQQNAIALEKSAISDERNKLSELRKTLQFNIEQNRSQSNKSNNTDNSENISLLKFGTIRICNYTDFTNINFFVISNNIISKKRRQISNGWHFISHNQCHDLDVPEGDVYWAAHSYDYSDLKWYGNIGPYCIFNYKHEAVVHDNTSCEDGQISIKVRAAKITQGEVHTVRLTINRININTSSESVLLSFRSIGPESAAAIIESRNKYGHFKNWDDFVNRNIVPKRVENDLKGRILY